ncbi:MAG: hypothetical protein Kow00124_11880 [Anaerolineae bacterium]
MWHGLRKRWLMGALVILAALAAWAIIAPPRWWLNLIKPVDLSDPVASGELLVIKYGCTDCHRIEGQGALTAPDLSGVTERLDDAELRLWLRSPRSIRPGTAMPDFNLSDAEVEAIVAYLTALSQP